jgi:secreted trypsin-like serine protease
MIRILMFCFVLSSFGCSGNLPVPVSQPRIVGGKSLTKGDSGPLASATVALTTQALKERGRSFCTAVLLQRSVLITAAHCVVDDHGQLHDGLMIAAMGPRLSRKSASARVVRAFVRRDYNPYTMAFAEASPMNDLALLKLDQGLSGTPVAVADPSHELEVESALALMGYGVSATRAKDDTGRLREVDASIVRVAAPGRMLMLRGPMLGFKVQVPGDQKGARAHGGACAGDSGGPAFLRLPSGENLLAGIASFATEARKYRNDDGVRYCSGQNGYVDMRHYFEEVNSAVQAIDAEEAPVQVLWKSYSWANPGT